MHVERRFDERLGVPFAARRRKEIAAIHMNRAGQAVERVGDGVDDVAAQRFGLALAQRLRARRLDLAAGISRQPPPPDVVLAAGIDADDRPHQMVVRPHGHPGSPDDVEDRQIGSVIELLHFARRGSPIPLSTPAGSDTARATTSRVALCVGSARTAARHSSINRSRSNMRPSRSIIAAAPTRVLRDAPFGRSSGRGTILVASKTVPHPERERSERSKDALALIQHYSAAAPASAAASERWPFWWK